MRRWLALSALVLASSAGLVCATGPASDPHALPADARVDRLVVDKSDRILEAYDGDTLLKRYRVAIGIGGEGPKVYEGDARTPEGSYRISARHRSAQYHRFLLVSYPNAADRERYRAARARGEVPAGRGIGGDVGIHGEPDHFVGLGINHANWTAGCIAVDNDEIEELYRSVEPDARIEIRP